MNLPALQRAHSALCDASNAVDDARDGDDWDDALASIDRDIDALLRQVDGLVHPEPLEWLEDHC